MGNEHDKVIITIDGPAGAGKSTVAKALASKLNYSYLDTGAMYRALTLKALRNKINLEDEKTLVALAHQTHIELRGNDGNSLVVVLDGEDVTGEIRSVDVTNNTHYIAREKEIRKIMVCWQRSIGEKENVVVEGRDVGTVVFPDATRKFYLDADFNERSRRRIEELKDKGKEVNEKVLKADLNERDNKDISRDVGPLRQAEDAVFIDSTHLSVEDVVTEMLNNL